MNFSSPSRILEAAAKAKLYGTFREAFTIVLGIAIVAGSSLLQEPQEWIVAGMGAVTFALGFGYLWSRLHRSRGESR